MSRKGLVKLFSVNSVPVSSRQYTMCLALGLRLFATPTKGLHITTSRMFPQAVALQLPTNIVDINSAEMGRFSPLRERDISGPVINAHDYKSLGLPKIDVTMEADPHVGSYDCRGAVNLSSSMQSNVPSPFSGNQSHLGMPGSQWGQGYKYLSEHLHSSHYLTLRNQYRALHSQSFNGVAAGVTCLSVMYIMLVIPFAQFINVHVILTVAIYLFQRVVVVVRSTTRRMSSEAKDKAPSLKDKLKKTVAEYGATVMVFHITISLLSLGTCYMLVSSGVDVAAILTYFNIGDGIAKMSATNAGTFVVAYALHKLFVPARLTLTITATPFLVRYLRKIGILKPQVKS